MSAVAAAIGGGSMILGAVASSNAANKQAAAASDANNTQIGMYNQSRADLAPYRQAGATSLNYLQGSMGDLTKQFSMNDYQQDPGYQFRLNQGTQAMERSAAAKGMLNSMGTMQNLNNYAQDQASNEYQNAYNRFTQSQSQRYNMLSGVANMGMGAANTGVQMGMNTADQMGKNMITGGNNSAAGMMGMANVVSGGVGQYTNMAMGNQMMNRFAPQQQPGGAGPTGMGSMQTGSSMSNFAGPDSRMTDFISA